MRHRVHLFCVVLKKSAWDDQARDSQRTHILLAQCSRSCSSSGRDGSSALTSASLRRRLSPSRRDWPSMLRTRTRTRSTLVHDIARMQKIAFSQFRDVDQPFQAVFNASKSAEIHNIGDDPFDELADVITLIDRLPGIGQQAFDA